MKNISVIIVLATLSCTTQAQTVGNIPFAEGEVQRAVYDASTAWKPCPPTLPENCEIAILEGHPKKPDVFTIRFRAPADFYMPPHTHPKDERVTLLRGRAAVAFGANAARKDAKTFGPGDFYINARNAVHKVWLDKGTVLQITGIGPWTANYVSRTQDKPHAQLVAHQE